MSIVRYEQIKNNKDIQTYIRQADQTLITLGYTEHSLAHVTKVAENCEKILLALGYDARTAELAKIAGYMHDIGNVINRIDHAQSGAVMAFRILDNLGMDAMEIAMIISAIGNHDENTASTSNIITAVLILSDKSDVRRSRVRNHDFSTFDIHDRVNYAAKRSDLNLDIEAKTITLDLSIDNEISSVMDYFEIFMKRMLLCRRAADYLGLKFKLTINDSQLL